MIQENKKAKRMRHGESGYTWLFFDARRAFVLAMLVTLLVTSVSGTLYWWYSRYGDDPTPSGNVGLGYGLMGLTLLVMAGTLYSIRRRFQNTAVGRLNRALNWHVCFALSGLALLLMHSFGNVNANSGTYALASLIALSLSGLLGRFLDRYLSWRIAVEVDQALTAEGEDRVESLVQEIQQIIVTHDRNGVLCPPELQHAPVPLLLLEETGQLSEHWSNLPMDLAYTSLEKMPQQLNYEKGNQRFLFSLEHPVAPQGQEQLAALLAVQQAMRRERFYRSVIHSWRLVHIALAFLTLGLTIWHIVYALGLLLPDMRTRFFI